jgi:hypothetical protein
MLFSVALRIIFLSGFALSAMAVPIPGEQPDPPKGPALPAAKTPQYPAFQGGFKLPPPNPNNPEEWPPLPHKKWPAQSQPAQSQPADKKWPALSAISDAQKEASRKAAAKVSQQLSTHPLQREAPKNFMPLMQRTLGDYPLLEHVWVRAKPLAANDPQSQHQNPGRVERLKDANHAIELGLEDAMNLGLMDAIRLEVKHGKVVIWFGRFFGGVNADATSVSWERTIDAEDFSTTHVPLNGYWAEVGSLLQAPSTLLAHLGAWQTPLTFPVEGRQVIQIAKGEGNSGNVRFLGEDELQRNSGKFYLFQNYHNRDIPTKFSSSVAKT